MSFGEKIAQENTSIAHKTVSQDTRPYLKKRLWQNSYFISIMVRQSNLNVYRVPYEQRTFTFYQHAVQQEGSAIGCVPKAYFQDPAFCLQMVKACSFSLDQVPDRFIDESFADAVIDHYRALYFKQSTGYPLFTTHHHANFFHRWQEVETRLVLRSKQEVHSYSLTFCEWILELAQNQEELYFH